MATTRVKPHFNKDFYETQAWQENRLIIGVDEVGRGCLAGPVVAAAVMLNFNKKSRLIKDSKLLDEKELQKSYNWIIKNSFFGVGIVNNRSIDALNIYQATLLAMKRAVMQLLAICPAKPSLIVTDAMPLNIEHIDTIHFIKGERKSSSIAAASIVAKVTRDGIMHQLEKAFPGYGYERHKGYSTACHKKALIERGQSIIHRNCFIDHFINNDLQEMLPFEQETILDNLGT